MPKHTLHIINKNFSHRELYQQCFQSISPGDSLILIEDAVYAICDINSTLLEQSVTLYALAADVNARDLANRFLAVKALTVINDAEFVTLCCAHKKTVSWF